MSETNSVIRVVAQTPAQRARIVYYLRSETRPALEEDVPEEELPIFEKLEFAEIPEIINYVGENTLDSHYFCVEESDLESIIEGLVLFSPTEIYLYFADDEEYRTYKQYKNGKYLDLYQLGDDDKIDKKLWEIEWEDPKGLDFIIEKFGK